jgi:serine-type D-Ala-D-Ala carboxypeptidase/endopeptidase (penicillin-binding protein 4)
MHESGLRVKKICFAISALVLSCTALTPAHSLDLPQTFINLSKSPTLNDPGILVVDPSNGETIYSNEPDKTRAPASVLKLISMTTALKTYGVDKVFTTTINATAKSSVYVISGERDPWLTASQFEAKKYHRAYEPYLINKVLIAHPHLRFMTLYYKDVYTQDLVKLQRFFKGRIKIVVRPLTVATADALTIKPVATIKSPPLSEIIKFTLLWSDNTLADRLAHSSAYTEGLPTNVSGLQSVFEKTLKELNVPAEGLLVQDGNGLSHETRVSARTITSLLVEIKKNPELKVIYDGLPTAGETGTLKTRFIKDAPSAVGLVKAKTGWIDTTVSLAGFVTVGENQYAFTFIADRIINRESARSAARETIDKMLGTIAKPGPTGTPAPAPTNP